MVRVKVGKWSLMPRPDARAGGYDLRPLRQNADSPFAAPCGAAP